MMPGNDMGFARPKTGICYAFLRGECNRGESCRFTHNVSNNNGGGGAGGDGGMGYMGAPQFAPAPTGFCFAFQRGECFRGDACKYSHNIAAGGAMGGGMGGDFMGGGGYGGGGGFPSAGRKPCFAFQRGDCQHGESCRFAHVPADGRNGGFQQPQRPSRKPCFAFINTGNCERGAACRFSHDPSSMLASMNPGMNPGMVGGMGGFPNPAMLGGGNPMGGIGGGGGGGVCFAFQRGQCNRGDSCKYAHIPGGDPSVMPGMPGMPGVPGVPGMPVVPGMPPMDPSAGADMGAVPDVYDASAPQANYNPY